MNIYSIKVMIQYVKYNNIFQCNNYYDISAPPLPAEASSVSLLPNLDMSSPPPIELEAIFTPLLADPKASVPIPEIKRGMRGGRIGPSR